MKLIKYCDADTLYTILSEIGVNMKELDKKDPSVQYLREIYSFLLYAQLSAWKSGKSHRQVIRAVNQTLVRPGPLSSSTK